MRRIFLHYRFLWVLLAHKNQSPRKIFLLAVYPLGLKIYMYMYMCIFSTT